MSDEKGTDEAVSSTPKASVTFAPALNGSNEPATSSTAGTSSASIKPPLPSSSTTKVPSIRTSRFDDDDDLQYPPKPRPRIQFSPESDALINESKKLLQMQPSAAEFRARRLGPSASTILGGGDLSEDDEPTSSTSYRRNPLAASSSAAHLSSTPRYPLHTPIFHRVDFDDVVEDTLRDRKPAWRELRDNVKDSYHKPKRTVERHKEMNDFMDVNLSRRRLRRSQSPFAHLDSESFLPRAPSWLATGAMHPRGLHSSASVSSVNFGGSGPYAAPALSSSKGIESRYDKMVDDIELRLLKTTLLPEYMKTVTKYEFKRGPQPSSGSIAEELLSEAEMAAFAPKPYYSRPSRGDPDYFDFDLEHSVNMFRKPEGRYFPRGPQDWENKVIGEVRAKGDAPISGHMFSKPNYDWRSTGTSYLSAALRTPSFWEHRFANIGSQVRDSNPISMASLERNRPVPNKFTEYKDPDFDGLSDKDDD